MLFSYISFDNNAQSFEIPRKKSSVTEPGDHILLGFYDAWSFDTPIINNHSVTAPSALLFLDDEISQYFETPKTNHSVTAPSSQILSGYGSLKCQHKNRTHRPGQKLPPPGK